MKTIIKKDSQIFKGEEIIKKKLDEMNLLIKNVDFQNLPKRQNK